MTADTFDACVEGYQDHLFDLQILSVQQGFWSGYYGFGSRHPKSPDKIANSLIKEKQGKGSGSTLGHADEVDVEEFLRMEQQFQRRLQEGETDG